MSALCPVHQLESTGTCSRCGLFVCAECGPVSVCGKCLAMPLAGVVEPAVKRARDLAMSSFGVSGLLFWQYGRFVQSREGQLGLLLLALGMCGLGIAALVRRPKGATRVVVPAIAGIVVSLALAIFSLFFFAGWLVFVPNSP